MKPAARELQSAMSVTKQQVIWFFVFGVLLITVVHFYRPSLTTVQVIFPANGGHSLAMRDEYGSSGSGRDNSCNPFTGDWVAAPEYRPYYTNDTCPQIHEQQNCMKHGRPDTDYMYWRWQPYGCDLPRFDARRFLEMVRGKTMAFVGDSLARNQMQSLKCMLTSAAYPQDLSDDPSDEDNKRFYYPSHNFTLVTIWSPILVNGHSPPTNGDELLWAIYVDEPYNKWTPRLPTFDYLILSGGNWFVKRSLFFRNNTVIGCHMCELPGVKDLTLLYSNRMAFRTAMAAITHPNSGFKGTVLLRTLSPDHFENGDWDTGGACTRTRPFETQDNVGLKRIEFELYKAQVEEFLEAKGRAGPGRGIQFRLLDVAEAMAQRPDGHPNKYGHWPYANTTFRNDCVHWCMPGPVDVWNELMMLQMTS